MKFTSSVRLAAQAPVDPGLMANLKYEVMFFGASPAFVRQTAGAPITNAVLNAAVEALGAQDLEHVVIDTRVHMLMPGWYPCIPGWHHDDVARTRSDGQPNYAEQPYLSRHVLLVLNADLAPTEFAIGVHELPDVPLGQKVYETWHPIVERQIEAGELQRVAVKDRYLYTFDWQAMHRGVEAAEAGWRYFCRASVRTPRHRNEIRRQVQAYLPAVNAGW